MTPAAQFILEHGQGIIGSDLEHVETPVDHDDYSLQGSMVPPTVISTSLSIDQNMSLDPIFFVAIEETFGSDPTQKTHLTDKNIDTSLVLPSIEYNIESLMKTEEFLDFVDDLSQEPSPLLDKEGTLDCDTSLSDKHHNHWILIHLRV